MIQRAPEEIIHLVFDIDYTLTAGHHGETQEELIERLPYLTHFERNGLFIEALCPHVLFPGALELVQWVFNIPNVKVAFFSAGEKGRNTLFVSKLLSRAFGEASKQLQHDVAIYSKEDLVPEEERTLVSKIAQAAIRFFSGKSSTMKKNLEAVLRLDSLDNVILIDDNPAIIADKQERNVLLTPSVDMTHFDCFHHPYSDTFPDEGIAECILSMNHIFYIAGMLSWALGARDQSVADELFSLQYQHDPEGGYMLDKSIHRDIRYYQEGLRVLQTVNPALAFYGGERANAYFSSAKQMAPTM